MRYDVLVPAGCICIDPPVPSRSHPTTLLNRLLALLIAVSMVWQGIEAARASIPGSTDGAAVVALTLMEHGADGSDCGLCGDPDCKDGAGHLQQHATAALATPLTLVIGRPAAERIMRDNGLMPSADANTPLRPPRTSPIARM